MIGETFKIALECGTLVNVTLNSYYNFAQLRLHQKKTVVIYINANLYSAGDKKICNVSPSTIIHL